MARIDKLTAAPHCSLSVALARQRGIVARNNPDINNYSHCVSGIFRVPCNVG